MPMKTGPEAQSASYSVGTNKSVVLTTDPLLMLKLKEEYSYTSTPCLGLHGLF